MTAAPDWKREAKARTLAEVYPMLNIGGMKKSGGHSFAGPCPRCGGTDRFWINTSKCRWACRGCNPRGGDAIALVSHILGLPFKEACHYVIGKPVAEMSPQEREKRKKQSEAAARKRELEQARDKARRLETAKGIWQASVPLGEIAFNYLRSRGIDPSVADDQLRFHPRLKHPEGGTFPAIVARVSNAEGEGVGCWRIYLKPDGSGKAPVEAAKLGLGNVAGGAVRIGGVWPVVCVCEGIETALAVRELVGGGWPVWACLSTSGMKALVLPPEIETVHIYADADCPKPPKNGRTVWLPSPGLSAAQELKKRLEQEGRTVTIQQPVLGTDWLDCLAAAKRVDAA